ncbi:hypothetical protein K5X82_00075 [Halosquirtibacter xylanolyticus]|nr:hypothetical protein K5X82_00075 [Prolixibacteraceae bacterium]
MQAIFFLTIGIVIISSLHSYFRKSRNKSSEVENYSSYMSRLKGNIIVAEEDLEPLTVGRGNLDLKIWSIKSKEEVRMGDTLEVIGSEGPVLWVQKFEPSHSFDHMPETSLQV